MNHELIKFIQSESGRVILSVLTLIFALIALKFSTKAVISKELAIDKKRQLLVINKNMITVVSVVLFIIIWAGKLAGFALSLAAIAGAILIVSKEAIMCIYGYITITFTKPFNIGDFIEIANFKGKVINYNLFSITLANTDVGNQLTGKNTSIPNSMLLSTPCVNASSTGRFTMDVLKLSIPMEADVVFATHCANEAAGLVTQKWVEQANQHLESLEEAAQISLPSARHKVLWQSSENGRTNSLFVRFTCPKDQVVDCEQQIFIKFWELFRAKETSKK